MRSGDRYARSTRRLLLLFAAAILVCAAFPRNVHAQAAAAAFGGPAPSRVDIFAGYAYYHPSGSDINYVQFPPITFGATGSVAGYFTRHFGLQAEGQASPNSEGDNNCAYTAQAGPIVRLQKGRFVPFLHALGGGAIAGGPLTQRCDTWGWGTTGGLGLDIILPGFHDRLALRPIQADFVYSHIQNGPATSTNAGGLAEVYAARGSAGLVFRLGNINGGGTAEPTLNCSVDPASPLPGDPVTLSASTLDLNPKKKPFYLWSTSGGRVVSDGAAAVVDTGGLNPGTYQVSGKVVEGDKQRLVASCSASFVVQAFRPPTVACTADRPAINSGVPVTIMANASSPQNRPLTYRYTTSAGVVTGEGPTATLNSAGVNPGNITVTCNVQDDKGQQAVATVFIVVATPPPPPPLPQVQPLCSITFDRDRKRPDRVDNEAKGCLDDVALTMQRESADRLVMIGSHNEGENNRNSAERVMNAADYLTKEKGIDPARLDLRIGPDSSRAVAMLLVPPAAVVDAGDATSFDTTSVKRRGEAYGTGAKPAAKRKPVRKKAAPRARPSDFSPYTPPAGSPQ